MRVLRTKVTVTGLIGDGYQVVSSFADEHRSGLFLQKADSLYVCFVSETPRLARDVKTNFTARRCH